MDWTKYYKIDPQDFQGTEEQQRLVKGGTVSEKCSIQRPKYNNYL